MSNNFWNTPISDKKAGKIALVVLGVALVFWVIWSFPTRTKTITVVSNDTIGRNASTSSCLVQAKDGQAYSVHWSILRWHWNHMEVCSRIKAGATYTVETNSRNVPWLLSNENILSASPVK